MTETCKHNPLFTAAILAILTLLQGCATLGKDECKLADWRLIGYQDGVAGKQWLPTRQCRTWLCCCLPGGTGR
jgi:hypothetical protein